MSQCHNIYSFNFNFSLVRIYTSLPSVFWRFHTQPLYSSLIFFLSYLILTNITFLSHCNIVRIIHHDLLRYNSILLKFTNVLLDLGFLSIHYFSFSSNIYLCFRLSQVLVFYYFFIGYFFRILVSCSLNILLSPSVFIFPSL